jgi:hypothetical protein
VETYLCHAQSVEALPVRLETGAFEQLILPSAIQFSRIYDRRSYKKASAPVDALAEQCFL